MTGFLRTLRDRLAFKSWYTDNFQRDMLAELERLRSLTERAAILAKEEYVARLLADERYADPRRLERFGYKVYSQYDEDGIIEEIFRRIGTTDRRFVEFGVEDGLENNTLKLLLEGWKGLWIEADSDAVAAIRRKFDDKLRSADLTVVESFITAENIDGIIKGWGTGEIDLLSIDIDGNDFHVWQKIRAVRPRVVVIEYNSKFPPHISVTPRYRADRVWRGTDYMGASLEALVRLGRTLNYSLVGCNLAGINAFFVRDDLVQDRFQPPYTSANHYQPARYFLWHLYHSGHPPDWGAYENVPE